MSIKITRKGRKISEEVIRNFERIIGSKLPEDYRKFLAEYNGGEPEANEFDIPDDDNSSGINEFLNINEIKKEKEILGKRLVPSAWPIAHAECGNLVCIIVGEKEGKIYFWDHEFEADENELPSWKNMFLLAPNFSEFWNSLKKFDPGKIELKPGQVESIWIDPDFLKE